MSAWDLGRLLRGLPLARLFQQSNSQGRSSSSRRKEQGPERPLRPSPPGPLSVCAVGVAAGLALGPLLHHQYKTHFAACALDSPPCLLASSLPFASISTSLPGSGGAEAEADAEGAPAVDTEPRTGLQFLRKIPAQAKKPCCKKPGEGDGPDQVLAGTGVRVKNLFGLASIKVYAFGVYLEPEGLRQQLGGKYAGTAEESVVGSKWVLEDLLASDFPLTVRLIISYKGLSIGQVRKAFTDSVGTSLQKLSGEPQTELLTRFTKLFTDDHTLHRGTIIDLRRGTGHVVTTYFDGKAAGSVKSALLSRALFNLYLGSEPFDASARDAVKKSLAKLVALR